MNKNIITELLNAYEDARKAAERADALKNAAKEKIENYMLSAGLDSIQDEKHRAALKITTRETIDAKRLKAERPDVAEHYTKTSEFFRFDFK